MSTSSIPIAFITDENYVVPTCVAIISLLATKHQNTVYKISVIAADCSEAAKERLQSMPCVKLVDSSIAEYQHIKQLGYITRACLLKFNLCELLPEYKKVLYLDSDILVRGDLTDLYNTELGESYAAALYARREPGDSRKKINGGVILFNAEKMRMDNMKEKLASFRQKLGDFPSMDQMTFNLVLGESLIPLSLRYNCMPPILLDMQDRHGFAYINNFFQTRYANLDACIADATIIHYAAGLKPWKFTHAAYEEEWMTHYHNSPFGHETLRRCGKWGRRRQALMRLYKTQGMIAVAGHLFAFLKNKVTGRKPQAIWG